MIPCNDNRMLFEVEILNKCNFFSVTSEQVLVSLEWSNLDFNQYLITIE